MDKLPLYQFYHGNVAFDTAVQGLTQSGIYLIATTPGAESWASIAYPKEGDASLGERTTAATMGDGWTPNTQYNAIGVFNYGTSGAVVTHFERVPTLKGVSAYIYRYAILTLADVERLGGDWRAITTHPEFKRDLTALLQTGERPVKLPLLEVDYSPERRRKFVQESLNYFLKHFDGREEAALQLLSSLFDGGLPVAIHRLPEDKPFREEVAIALATLLPPSLRFLCSFATQVTSTRGCGAFFKFLDGYQSSDNSHRSFDWNRGTFGSTSITPNRYVQKALEVLKQGDQAFLNFLKQWDDKAARLLRAEVDDPFGTLVAWVEVIESWKDSAPEQLNIEGLSRLLGKDDAFIDPSIDESERIQWMKALCLALIRRQDLSLAKSYFPFLSTTFQKYPKVNDAIQAHFLQIANTAEGNTVLKWAIAWAEDQKLDRSWVEMPGKTAKIFNQYLCQHREIDQTHALLQGLDKHKHLINPLEVWRDILVRQVSLAHTTTGMNEDHSTLLLRMIGTLLAREDLNKVMSSDTGFVRALPENLKMQVAALIGVEKPPSELPGLWSSVTGALPGTSEEKNTFFLNVGALFWERKNVLPFHDIETLKQLLALADSGNTIAVSQVNQLSQTSEFLARGGKASFTLFGWNLKQVDLEQKTGQSNYWKQSHGMFENLARLAGERIDDLIQALVKHGASARLVTALTDNTIKDPYMRARYDQALLRTYPSSDWDELENSIKRTIQPLSHTTAPIPEKGLHDRLLIWQTTQAPDDPLTDHLMDWWVNCATNAVDLPQMINILLMGWQSGAKVGRTQVDRLTTKLRVQVEARVTDIEALRQIRDAAAAPELVSVKDMVAMLIEEKTFIPQGSIAEFSERVAEAAKVLHDLESMMGKIRSLKRRDKYEQFADLVRRNAQSNLTPQEREIMMEACTDLARTAYQLGRQYGFRDRSGFHWLIDRVFTGGKSRIEAALNRGRQKPQSAIGLLHWIRGVVNPQAAPRGKLVRPVPEAMPPKAPSPKKGAKGKSNTPKQR